MNLDKVVLVTAASSGVARELAAAGARVAVGARRVDRLERLADEIGAAGGTAMVRPLDVTDSEDVAGFADAAREAWKRVDMIVNDAGLMPLSPLGALNVDEWEWMVDVESDLAGTITDSGAAALMREWRAIPLQPDPIGRAVRFAIEQPDVDVNEIVVRPTRAAQ